MSFNGRLTLRHVSMATLPSCLRWLAAPPEGAQECVDSVAAGVWSSRPTAFRWNFTTG